jgi:hypothetical protein
MRVQSLGDKRDGDGSDTDEPPFLFWVFDQLPDNQRGKDSGRAYPMSHFAGWRVGRLREIAAIVARVCS